MSIWTRVNGVSVEVVMDVIDVRSRAVVITSRTCGGHRVGRGVGRIRSRLGAFEPVVEIFPRTHLQNEEEPLRSLEGLVEGDDVWVLR